MPLEDKGVNPESCKEEPPALTKVHIKFRLAQICFQLISISVHFFLRVDILELTGTIPPLLASLYNDSIGFEFFNKFFSTLCEKSTLIACSNKVNFLTLEPFS